MSQSQTQRSSRVDLLHGSTLKSLLLFALPIMASRVFQQIYNTMDTLIVGHTLGDSSIAAMGACSSIYEMMTGFTFGVGNGLAIVTARCFWKTGDGTDEKIRCILYRYWYYRYTGGHRSCNDFHASAVCGR
ncbi:MAG: MATE family efflux transporter [Fusicatenibacter saccharivorans]